MQVILRADVRGVGRRGDRKDVSDGHARNFLIPRGFAVPATQSALASAADDAARAAARTRREGRAAAAIRKSIDGTTLTIRAKTAPGGTLYAAIGPAQVAEALQKQGVPVIPEMVSFVPMKQPGAAEAVVTPAPGVRAALSVRITGA